MRRFCSYKRGRVWYAKLYYATTKRYLSGRLHNQRVAPPHVKLRFVSVDKAPRLAHDSMKRILRPGTLQRR